MKEHGERKEVTGRGKMPTDREKKSNRRKSRKYSFIGLEKRRNGMCTVDR